MNKQPENQEELIAIYRQRAKSYDTSGISGLEPWRKKAVSMLALKRGDLVLDIGCGTGLNFVPLQEAVGPEGKIIGVDLTDAMLDLARQRVAEHGWRNVDLVQSDAAEYAFPARVGGILSAFALSFIPDCALVIEKGAKALASGRKWVVLDMAWPDGLPLWFRHGLFFLSSWGITGDVIHRRPWKTVFQTMQQHLIEVDRKSFWMGFFYLASGTRPR